MRYSATHQFSEHLQEAKKEREEYRRTITETMSSFESSEYTIDTAVRAVYTFDFVQHVPLPNHVRQLGPTYFEYDI